MKLVPVDTEFFKVSVDMRFAPERCFAASLGPRKYGANLKFYCSFHQTFVLESKYWKKYLRWDLT